MWTFGEAVESDMDKAERALGPKANGKRITTARQSVLDKYLSIGEAEVAKRFADPAKVSRSRRR